MKTSLKIWCCIILYFVDYESEVESQTKHSMQSWKFLLLVFISVPWNPRYSKPKSYRSYAIAFITIKPLYFRAQTVDVLFIKEAITFDLGTCVCLIAVPA